MLVLFCSELWEPSELFLIYFFDALLVSDTMHSI